jgi:hypothetical protein
MSLLDDVKYRLHKATPYMIDEGALRSIRGNVYAARQFIFNDEACTSVGRFIRECPDIIADNLEFALPPYDPCYIEVNLEHVYQEIHDKAILIPDQENDNRTGFLFVKNRVYVLVNSHDDPDPVIAVFGTYFKKLGPPPENRAVEIPGNEKLYTVNAQQILGSSYLKLNAARIQKFMETFGTFHCAINTPSMTAKMGDFLKGCKGEARTIAAILLMLYNKKHVVLRDMPYERRISRGKMRTYMAHTTVQISLTDPIEIRRAFSTGTGTPKRRHEVRTHYAHRRIATRCEHQWVRNEYADNEQWECSKCGGLRFLRREHLRGDGGVGFVKKTYEVKP